MAVTLVSAGDSFIWGSELADSPNCKPNGFSRKTFPALLADGEYDCVAFPGNGNETIARSIIEYCEAHKNKDMFMLVCWTFNGRYEFKFNDQWKVINTWSAQDDSDDGFAKSHIKHIQNNGMHDFAKMYFKHIGGSEFWETYTTLKEIVYVQNYLELHNIPYMFTCADNNFLHNHTYNSDNLTITSLKNQINFDQWYFFPPAPKEENWNTTEPRGFYQWAVENKYKCGPQHHPLEIAHQDAAELMREKFNELVKKSL